MQIDEIAEGVVERVRLSRVLVSLAAVALTCAGGAYPSFGDVKPSTAKAVPSSKPVAEAGAEGGIDSQVPVEMPEPEEASEKAREKLRRKGWRMLKPLQKVSAQKCIANPISCLCPAGTVRTIFHETPSYGQRARQLYMCQPTQCPEGRILRKRTEVRGGVVKYSCEEVEE